MEPLPGRSRWGHGVVDRAVTTGKTRVAADFVSSVVAHHSDLAATESTSSGVHGSAIVSRSAFQFEDAEEEDTDQHADAAKDSHAMSRVLMGQPSRSHVGVPIHAARNQLDEIPDAKPAGLPSSVSQVFVSAKTDSISSVVPRDGERATTVPLVHTETSALAALQQNVIDLHSGDSSKSATTSIHQIPSYESHPTSQPPFMQRRHPDPQTTEVDILPENLMASRRRTLKSDESRVGLQGPLNDIATIQSAYNIKDLTTHDVLCGPNMGIFPTAG